jgi:membrane protease YdiL (CAAX protease family)
VEQLAPLFFIFVAALVFGANWVDRGRAHPSTAAPASASLFWLFLALIPAATAIGALLVGSSALTARPAWQATRYALAALILALTAASAAALLAAPIRARLAGTIPIDPASAVHATALVLSTALVGVELANQTAVDELSRQAQSGPVLGPIDVVLMELPLLILAVLGVGLLVRRDPGATADRLGLVRPQVWHIPLALAAAGAFFAFGVGMDALGHLLTPGLASQVQAANQRLFGGLSNVGGIVTIAFAAGVCEETLFRGALQPRLGLLWPAIVFTSVHSQYGLSIDALAVFVLALGLGLLRRVANTSTAIICHVTYNLVVGLAAAGVGVAWLAPGLAVEALLIALTLVVVFTARLPIRRLGT